MIQTYTQCTKTQGHTQTTRKKIEIFTSQNKHTNTETNPTHGSTSVVYARHTQTLTHSSLWAACLCCSLLTLPLPNVLQPCPHQCPLLHSLPLCLLLFMSPHTHTHTLSCATLSSCAFSFYFFTSLSSPSLILCFSWNMRRREEEQMGEQTYWSEGRMRSLGFVRMPACSFFGLCCIVQVFLVVCLWVCLLLFVPVCLYCSTSLWADQQA